MKRIVTVLFTLLVVLAISAASAIAQSLPQIGATVQPQEVCIIPKPIIIKVLIEDGMGQKFAGPAPVGFGVYVFRKVGDDQPNEPVNGTGWSQPSEGRPQGQLVDGESFFYTDYFDHAIAPGDFSIRVVADGYYGDRREFHAESGEVTIRLNIIRKVLDVRVHTITMKRGTIKFDLEAINDTLPDSEISFVLDAQGPTGDQVTHPLGKENFSNSGGGTTITKKYEFYIPDVEEGAYLTIRAFVHQKAHPLITQAVAYLYAFNQR